MSDILDIRTGKNMGGTNASHISEEHLKDVISAANQANSGRKTIKLTDYKTEVCPNCGGKLFTTAFMIKDIPGSEFGELTTETYPTPITQMPVMVCVRCGEIAKSIKDDKEAYAKLQQLLDGPKDPEDTTEL